MTLEEIIVKNPEDLTDEEKTFLQENEAEMKIEDKEKFKEVLGDLPNPESPEKPEGGESEGGEEGEKKEDE